MADDDMTTETESDSDLVKRLRAEIKQRDEALNQTSSELNTVKKQSAFRDVGIDPSRGVGKLFFENYNGDLTVDAVKSAAEEYELPIGSKQPTQSAPTTQTQSAPTEEQMANKAIDSAVQNSEAGGKPNDPTQAAWEAYEATMQKTGSREKAMASHFGAKLQAAVESAKNAK